MSGGAIAQSGVGPGWAPRALGASGALLAMLSVVAFTVRAHLLRGQVDAELLAAFESASRQQAFHALALLVVAGLSLRRTSRAVLAAGWLLLAGVGLFSGSLYLVTLAGLEPLRSVVPLGGVCFLAGWLCLAWGLLMWPAGGQEES